MTLFAEGLVFCRDTFNLFWSLLLNWRIQFVGSTVSFGVLILSGLFMMFIISYFWRGGKK